MNSTIDAEICMKNFKNIAQRTIAEQGLIMRLQNANVTIISTDCRLSDGTLLIHAEIPACELEKIRNDSVVYSVTRTAYFKAS